MKHLITFLTVMLITIPAYAGVVDKKVATPTVTESKPEETTDGMLRIDSPALSVDLKAVQKAFNTSANTDNIKTFYYDENKISKIKLRVGMRSLIHFDKTEVVSSYIVGNSSIFKVQGIPSKAHESGIVPNILTIKALYPGADTNLTVITESGRVYTFYLRSYPITSWEVPDITIYMKLFDDELYPTKEYFASDIKEEIDKRVLPNFSGANVKSDADYLNSIEIEEKPNMHYRIFGDKTIAPYAVYDDGVFTYFDFRHNLTSDRLPVVYKVVDGYDTITNFRMEKGFLIAESLSPEGWTLRNGNQTVCIKPSKALEKVHPRPPRTQFEGSDS